MRVECIDRVPRIEEENPRSSGGMNPIIFYINHDHRPVEYVK